MLQRHVLTHDHRLGSWAAGKANNATRANTPHHMLSQRITQPGSRVCQWVHERLSLLILIWTELTSGALLCHSSLNRCFYLWFRISPFACNNSDLVLREVQMPSNKSNARYHECSCPLVDGDGCRLKKRRGLTSLLCHFNKYKTVLNLIIGSAHTSQ